MVQSLVPFYLIYIYINDIFYFVDEDRITNYEDDTTPYIIENNVEILLTYLLEESLTSLKWFDSNFLQLNPDKLLVTNLEQEVYISLDNQVIRGNKSVKLLVIKIDNKLDFNEHISSICKKAGLKLCPGKGSTFHEQRKATSSNESFYRCSIQLLSANLDVS